jgi:hypothetical protein
MLSQNLNAQNPPPTCLDFTGLCDKIYCLESLHEDRFQGPYYIKVYFNFLRYTNGSGFNESIADRMETITENLYNAYSPYNIYFVSENDCNELDYQPLDDSDNLSSDLDILKQIPNTLKSDAVTAYILPDSWPDPGFGNSDCIPGTSFMLVGTYESLPSSATHSTSHEMGHVLGLFHTHYGDFGPHTGCDEEIDGSNCQECGDCVCETPHDPNGLTLDANCNYQGSQSPAPDVRNFMSNTSPRICHDHFAIEQGKRMRNMIATADILQPFIVQNTEITQNTTWSTQQWPQACVIVKSGFTLTITGTVNMREGAYILVEPNAVLDINGGIITNSCNRMWRGVIVQGDKNQRQLVQYQGKAIVRNGGVIEHAVCGVQLQGLNEYGEDDDTATGGILITSSDAIFRNNIRSVLFQSYQNTNANGQPSVSACSFNDTHFITDNYYRSTKSPEYVFMRDVYGIRLIGCSYRDERTALSFSTFKKYATGIKSVDSWFQVVPKCLSTTFPCEDYQRSSFYRLAKAITASNTFTSRSFEVKQSDFESCFTGIEDINVSAPLIINNNFYLSKPSNFTGTDPMRGVAFYGTIIGLTIEENYFEKTTGNTLVCTGTYSSSLGTFNNIIRRNAFNGLDYANIAVGENATNNPTVQGLNYDCNYHVNTVNYDFSVPDATFTAIDNIRSEQGLSINPTAYNAAGNVFSHSVNNSTSDFLYQGQGAVNYHYLNNTPETPLYYSGITPLISQENECPVTYCEPPCRSEEQLMALKNEFYENKAEMAEKNSDLSSPATETNTAVLQAEISQLRNSLDQVGHIILLHILHDTLGLNKDSLKVWLSELDRPESATMLTKNMIYEADYEQALSQLNNTSETFQLSENQAEQTSEVNEIMSIVMDDLEQGNDLQHLPATSLEILKEIALTDGTDAAYLAKSILRYYDLDFDLDFYLPQPNPEMTEDRSSEILVANTSENSILTIYPNPANDEIHFTINKPDLCSTEMIITNAIGKVIKEVNLSGSEATVIFSHSNWPPGVYFCHLVCKETMIVNKFIVR